MTLEEIKDQVAKEKEYSSWSTLETMLKRNGVTENPFWPEVCRRAQLECGRLTLEKAAKKADCKEVIVSSTHVVGLRGANKINNKAWVVKKSTITDPSNIVIVQ